MRCLYERNSFSHKYWVLYGSFRFLWDEVDSDCFEVIVLSKIQTIMVILDYKGLVLICLMDIKGKREG